MVDNPTLGEGLKNSIRTSPSDFEAFNGMKIDSASFLDDIDVRQKCPKCSKSRKFFCYTCYIPMQSVEGKLPKVKV